MTTFVFVRHGETLGTKDGLFTGGKTDSLPSDEGVLGTKLHVHKSAHNETEYFDACLTSTMKRTRLFGHFFKEYFGGPVFADCRLDEKDAGVFEGCEAKDFLALGWEEKHINRWATPLPCGESHYEVALRVVEALKFWEQEFPDQRILVGSHTDVIRAIKAPHDLALSQGEGGRFVFSRRWRPSRSEEGHPTDEQLTIPIPYFYSVEIDSSLFHLED